MITGIILASGFSKRMKTDKLTMDLNGKAIIQYVIEASKTSNLDDILLVYRSEAVKEIGERYNIKTIYNENANLGQSQAIKIALKEIDKNSSFMFLMGDQPLINSNLINKLIKEYKKREEKILVPYYDGKKGMPVIFPNTYRNDLLQIEGDKGGREIILREHSNVHRIDIENINLGKDIDTLIDLEEVKTLI